ncbi:MAG: PIN domain-containing protein [Lachnospira sp.]|nr:PIN domain-containing protein [Lachnospira sp.]
MRVLIDTNVIVDALTSREPWNKSAEQIFLMAAHKSADMYISASMATDIYYLVRKYCHDTELAMQTMEKLYNLFGILDVTKKDCIQALTSSVHDYEDAVVCEVAKRSGMHYIVTRNTKDYVNSYVKAILPDEFIERISD